MNSIQSIQLSLCSTTSKQKSNRGGPEQTLNCTDNKMEQLHQQGTTDGASGWVVIRQTGWV